MRKGVLIGILFIVFGIGLFAYYDYFIRSGREARALIIEAKLHFERGDKQSIESSINLLSKVVARYPGTRAETESYYYIAQGYEKLGLPRLAYFKYLYILKNNHNLNSELDREIRTRLAHLRIRNQRTEEGVNQLLGLLNYSTNRDFRSKVYSELGHAYLDQRSYNKSNRMFDIALIENRSNEEALLGKAKNYRLMGRPGSAYDLYEYFLKYHGGFSQYTDDVKKSFLRQVYNSGYQSYRRGRYWESIRYLKRLIKNFPGSSRSENANYWIGESYYALKRYNSAISYFNRTLSNGYNHKNQDARIKKGYTYFMRKQFDLAAREFQIYINHYPRGRHISTARQWKDMSQREILYRIKDRMLPETKNEGEEEDSDFNSEGVSQKIADKEDQEFEEENIAEL